MRLIAVALVLSDQVHYRFEDFSVFVVESRVAPSLDELVSFEIQDLVLAVLMRNEAGAPSYAALVVEVLFLDNREMFLDGDFLLAAGVSH